jgi:hypothetical protein
MKSEPVIKMALGIAAEVLYAFCIMLAAFFICLVLYFNR